MMGYTHSVHKLLISGSNKALEKLEEEEKKGILRHANTKEQVKKDIIAYSFMDSSKEDYNLLLDFVERLAVLSPNLDMEVHLSKYFFEECLFVKRLRARRRKR